MMLDEFPALGRLDFFESALAFMAGYGIRAYLIAQSLNQIAKAYGENNAILDNCHGHELCRRFMQIPGVGPIAALSFMTAIDDPSRFRRSRDVAAYLGRASRRWQSGSSIDVQGRISKAGDADVRRALYEAASALLTRYKKKDKVKSWGLALPKRASHRKATVAVARKLAVIMHAMWVDGTFYCGDPDAPQADVNARAAAKERKLLGAHA